MAVIDTPLGTLKRLNASIEIGVPAIINTTSKAVRTLLKILKEEKIITEVKLNEKSKVITPAQNIRRIKILSTNAKAKQLKNKANELLPSGYDHLLVSTNKGITTHQKAISNGLGGKILAIIEKQ